MIEQMIEQMRATGLEVEITSTEQGEMIAAFRPGATGRALAVGVIGPTRADMTVPRPGRHARSVAERVHLWAKGVPATPPHHDDGDVQHDTMANFSAAVMADIHDRLRSRREM